jgi:hypothetical protein
MVILIRSIVAATAAAVTLMLGPATGQAVNIGPVLGWSPTTSTGVFDYGTLTFGQSVTQTFTLTNSGGSATGTLTVTLSGSGAFTKTSDACTGRSLGRTSSCRVSVQYSPNAEGASDTATLTATGEKPAPASLTLKGAGAVVRHIYWTNAETDTIGRANLDGSGVNQSFISVTSGNQPNGVAVDAHHVYWSNGNCLYPPGCVQTIGRANLDGSGVNQSFITGTGPFDYSVAGLAVDANYIYWANWSTTGNDTIGRANLDGSGVNPSFITGASGTNSGSPIGIAVDANYIYWSNITCLPCIGTIARANLDGSGVNLSLFGAEGGPGSQGPDGVAVDSNYIYWTILGNAGIGGIGRANLDGSGANNSFITGTGTEDITSVAVDADHVYWTNGACIPCTGSIGRANLDGSGVNPSFITTGASFPAGVAVG